MKPLSLYIHIPFCQKKCPYCDFYSVAGSNAPIAPYMSKVRDEMAFFAQHLAEQYEVCTIYFGGGTPSFVPTPEIETTLVSLRKLFRVQPKAEITLEINPGSCDRSKLKTYRKMGINRLSIGIQSFHDNELQFLGRIHTSAQAHDTIRSVLAADYDNFSLDFIYAIPNQTPASWENTLRQALAYTPPHISTYNLTVEEGTPLARHINEGGAKLLSDTLELSLYKKAIQLLTNAGLAHYEISNFAKPTMPCRHNLAYWSGQDYLGFGAGAHSYLEGKRFSKKRSIEDYIRTTTPDFVDCIADEDLSPSRRFWELVVIGLRNLEGVDLNVIASEQSERSNLAVKTTGLLRRYTPRNDPNSIREKLQPWIKYGFLEWKGNHLKLKRKGIFYYDEIARNLI